MARKSSGRDSSRGKRVGGQEGASTRRGPEASPTSRATGGGAAAEVGMVDARAINDPLSPHCMLSLAVAGLTVVSTALALLEVQSQERQELLGMADLSSFMFTAICTAFATVMCCACTCFAGRRWAPDKEQGHKASDISLYDEFGVGSTKGQNPTTLYLDLMRRVVSNIVYQDAPMWVYDHNKKPQLVKGFSIERRVKGEDWPIQAHTMVGMKRLKNIEELIARIAEDGIPGDVIETGVLRGGSCIYMKACLRAYQTEAGRRVIACDTFQPVPTSPSDVISKHCVLPLLRAIGSIPIASFNRALVMLLDGLPNPTRSFPVMQDPSDATVQIGMFLLRNLGNFPDQSGTSLDEVKDHFARYGLLDDNCVFLKGFFSDTLPDADIDELSLIRLDGDTYESTITAIKPLYPKLVKGGFVIVDDYNAFDECKRAIDEYRTLHDITEPLVPIDNLAVYWRKE